MDDALDTPNSVSYDNNDNVTSRTDDLSKIRSYTYDKLEPATLTGRQRQTRGRPPTTLLRDRPAEERHTRSGTRPLTGWTTMAVSPRWSRHAATLGGATPADYTWTYRYDEAGNRTRVTDPLDASTASYT